MTNAEIAQQILYKVATARHQLAEIENLALGLAVTPDASSANPWTSTATSDPSTSAPDPEGDYIDPVPDPIVTPPTSETSEPPATE